MAQSQLPIALRYELVQELLVQDTSLTKSQRRQLEREVQEMRQIAERAKAAQDATSAIYAYALWKTDATLAVADLLKSLRGPGGAKPELDEFEQSLRAQYLEEMRRIATRGGYRVFEASGR
ncbi:MAG: hypothetical protein H0U76_08895 [Ktedonobacteraceae bacterium]|nr:hypothetical protein [Ktedonobacteraceae bacterium]